MEKPEIDTLAKVPGLKAIIENENFIKGISCRKEEEEKLKEKKGVEYRIEDTEYKIEFGVNLGLECYLKKFFNTSLKKLEEDTGIPKDKIKEFFAEYLKEKVFATQT